MSKLKKIKHCQNCDKELPYHNSKFCSVKCKIDFIYKNKPHCLNCGKKCNNKYCSRECQVIYRATNLNCHTCGKEFTIRDKWRVKQGKVKYCSDECRGRKWEINIHYFDQLDESKLITLGQLIVTGHIVDYRTFVIISDEATILDLSNKLGSTYPIESADRRLLRINITSYSLVSKLVELGITDNYLFQDVPGDLWEGLKRTHCYEVVDGVNVFKTERSKVALWVCDRFGGKMVTRTYKDVARGCMGCEWVVIWR